MRILKVSLNDMLRCREQRARTQQELIARYGLPVACFTMNIPGEVKYTPLIEFAFREGVRRFEEELPKAKARVFTTSFTGCEAFFVFDEKAETIKKAAVAVEEGSAVARLYDIDAIGITGEKLSRGAERTCIVCGGPVTVCARSRAHGLDELYAHTNALLCGFAAKKLAAAAHDALITEVNATPKPGLVDRRNTGAHRDMDLESFYKSADALEPYFERMALAALSAPKKTPKALMKQLRALGLEAERAMFFATGGANTHKGAIFSMGLLLAGAGLYLQTGRNALKAAARLAEVGFSDALDAAKAAPSTNGEHVFAKIGAIGARGEAAGGFPTAFAAMNRLAGFMELGYTEEDAAVLALPFVMQKLTDTNLIHRGGEEGFEFAKKSADQINALPIELRMDAMRKLDDTFIEKNLSPGGCADILALALLMWKLEQYIEF